MLQAENVGVLKDPCVSCSYAKKADGQNDEGIENKQDVVKERGFLYGESNKKEMGKRTLIFLVGLVLNSFGVALVTKASLGTSPISSIPYVLSLNFPASLGMFTIFFSLLLITLQIVLLRKNFRPAQLLQIPVSLLFGYLIDGAMLLQLFSPQQYAAQLGCLLLGCVVLGAGVYLEVLADVVMLPGEAFVRAVTVCAKTEFGKTKIAFDVSMTVIAGVLSFVFAARLDGVGIGTIIAAAAVGWVAGMIARFAARVKTGA